MNYKILTKEILYKLGIRKKYRGCEYVLSCIQYISENEDTYAPITKILYVDVAKQFNTSNTCIERGVRNTIDKIWEEKNNEENILISKIFGQYNETNKPSNMQFLASLYDYMKLNMTYENLYSNNNFIFICPNNGQKCDYCNDIIMKVLDEIIL